MQQVQNIVQGRSWLAGLKRYQGTRTIFDRCPETVNV